MDPPPDTDFNVAATVASGTTIVCGVYWTPTAWVPGLLTGASTPAAATSLPAGRATVSNAATMTVLARRRRRLPEASGHLSLQVSDRSPLEGTKLKPIWRRLFVTNCPFLRPLKRALVRSERAATVEYTEPEPTVQGVCLGSERPPR